MNKYYLFLSLCLLLLARVTPVQAQYISTPPVRDGRISDGEYGNSENQFTAANGGTWYMTWDANYLYVAKTGGQNAEPNIMYLDLDPLLPVTGGATNRGNLVGNTDYSVTPRLPFRADVRVYFTNNYVEIRRRNGEGGWSAEILSDLAISNGGTTRELRLNWSSLTGGGTIPPTFNWLGYATNTDSGDGNVRYDQTPASPEAVGKTGGSTPSIAYYNTIINTASGSATKPFSLRSYTFPGVADDNNFGAINVWDFTMNASGRQISRGTSGGNWTINGSLVVGNGAVYFGNNRSASFGETDVQNVRVLGNGILSLDQTTKTMLVRNDVDLTGGGQFILSQVEGSDLLVGRDFRVTNGLTSPATFQSNSREVIFTPSSTSSSISHTIASNSDYVIPFTFLQLNTPKPINLGSSIAVGRRLTFNRGIIYTGSSNYVDLDGSILPIVESAESHIEGNTRITQVLEAGTSPTMDFGSVGLSLQAQFPSEARGTTTVTRVTGTRLTGVGGGEDGGSALRYFIVTGGNSAAVLNLLLRFTYRLDELNGIPEGNLALYRSTTGLPGTFERLTEPGAANTSSHTIARNGIATLTSGTYFALGDGVTPLPVTLTAFTATPTAQGAALLRWTTASELHNKGFGIERQLNGTGAWQQVGFVAAAGQAKGSGYTFTDNTLASAAPEVKQAYYRLRQEDLDGTPSYSPVAVVAREAGSATTALILSPVPVDGGNLSVTFAEAGQAGSDVTILNVQGQRMLHLTTAASTETALHVPVSGLAAGVYLVRVQVPGQAVRHARFVKL